MSPNRNSKLHSWRWDPAESFPNLCYHLAKMAGCKEAFTFFVRVDQGEGKSGRNHIPSLIGNYLLLYKEGRLDNKRAEWPLVVLLKKHRVRATMLGDASLEVLQKQRVVAE